MQGNRAGIRELQRTMRQQVVMVKERRKIRIGIEILRSTSGTLGEEWIKTLS